MRLFMKNNHYKKHPLIRLLLFIMPYKIEMISTIFFMGLVVLMQLSRPILLKIAIDTFISKKILAGFPFFALIFILFILFEFVFSYLYTFFSQKVAQKVMADLRINIFIKIEQQSLAFFDQNKLGNLISRLTSDVNNLQEMFSMGLLDSLLKTSTIVLILGILFLLDYRLALLVVVVLFFVSLIFIVFSKYVIEKYRTLRKFSAKLSGYIQENINGLKIIQVFNKQKYHHSKFSEINKDLSLEYRKVIFSFALFFPVIEFTTAITVAIILWVGGFRYFAGLTTIGTLVAFIDYIQRLFSPLQDLSERYNVLQNSTASAERIFNLLDDKDHIIKNGDKVLSKIKGDIEFRNVWFFYKPNEWVLKGVNFKIQAKEKIAIVGATGSGKSTILKLLLRFYDIQKGQILVDGLDIRNIDKQSLRQIFGYMNQEPHMFSDTIINNISLFDKNIELEKIRQAAEYTNAISFIKKNEKMFDFELSEKASNLSVGQKQLLAMSRIVAANPDVFLLDEATSNIDVITEKIIEENMYKLMQNRSSIVIAHRLSTIKNVNKIIVLDKGAVKEIGSHRQLFKKQGIYYKLYKFQYSM